MKRALVLYGVALVAVLGLVTRAAEEPKAEEPKAEESPKAARQQIKPERLVSDAAFLYIATPDLRKARAAFDHTAFRALLAEPDVSTPLIGALGKMRDAYVKGDGTRSETELRRRNNEVDLLARIAPLLQGSVALAVEGDLTSLLQSGMLPRFLLLAGAPVGDDSEKWQHELESILEKHRGGQGMDLRFKDYEERIGGYDVVRLENADLGVTEAWAFVENLFVYGQGKRIVEDAVERYAVKNGAGTLALFNGYQDVYKEVGRGERGDALVYVQADARPLLAHVTSAYPALRDILDPQKTALEAKRPHLALGMHLGEGDNAPIREKILVRLEKNLLMRGTGPCDGVTARFAPNDAPFFTAQQGSLADTYKNVSDMVARWRTETIESTKVTPFVERLKVALGVQQDADLPAKLALFKGELGLFASYMPQPNLKMDSLADYVEVFQPVLTLELDRDNALAENEVRTLLASIEKNTGHEYVMTTSGGTQQIFYQKGAAPQETSTGGPPGLFRNLDPLPANNKLPFFTAYARVDLDLEGGKQGRFLLLSDSLNAVKTATRQAQAKFSRASLAEERKFRDFCKSFREARTSVSYLDLPRLMGIYADELTRLTKANVISSEVVNQLPSANTIREHVFPMAWAASPLGDSETMVVECSSPMGNLPMVGIVSAVAWPAIIERQQEAVSKEVDEKFRHLMLALHLYAANFNRFPSLLSDLHPNYVKSLQMFESPFKRGTVKSPQDIDNPDLTNFVYVPNRSLQDLGSDVLLYEKEPTKVIRGRLFHHVLVLDARKTWMTKPALERALAGKAELITTNVADGPKGGKGGGSPKGGSPPKSAPSPTPSPKPKK
ncbi:MAG: hypothetical protein NTW87_14200 [Planctomycetota bacterium]|nr:hypothetical protein [Planctomycetota bacterium]